MIDLRFFARRKALTAIAVLTRCTRAPGERAGVAVGLVAMWLLSGALKSLVFGVQSTSVAVLATSGSAISHAFRRSDAAVRAARDARRHSARHRRQL